MTADEAEAGTSATESSRLATSAQQLAGLDTPAGLHVDAGVCYVLFAYDVGMAIDLAAAERRIATSERVSLHGKRQGAKYFEYTPAPLRVTQQGTPIAGAGFESRPTVELLIYDFAAVSVTYAIPLDGRPFASLSGLAAHLADSAGLAADSRRRVEDLIAAIGEAINKPATSALVEDYVVFHLAALSPGPVRPERLVAENRAEIAQLLRLERARFSDGEINEATSRRISYGPDDITVIDWAAALVIDPAGDDVIRVLEYANVGLLEMRFLDDRLDQDLEAAYETLSRGRGRMLSQASDLSHLAEMQVDGAIMLEGVNNALKLLGDQYLARVYRLASERFHLPGWNASILRKLEALDSIYGKLSDLAATRRLETLEWIIIVLIAISIVLQLLDAGH